MITTSKNKIPFFSVIICTYNRVKLLERALDSLLKQEEKDWEAIIVDDGSYDFTYELAMEMCGLHENFKYIFHSNRGLALSRNTGILAANGYFVTFLDSDDEYKPDHLATRKKILTENSDLDFLYGGVDVIGDPFLPDVTNPGEKIHVNDCVVCGTFFVKREEALNLGGFRDNGIAQDLDFYEKAHDSGLRITNTMEPTYIYHRDNKDSITKNFEE